MEIRKLVANDYDALLKLLNFTFANKYDHPMDFLTEQPKMWVRDDKHMSYHIGVFDEDVLCAVVGIYPLPVVIGGEKITLYTTGNVATHPDYEGRGYFTMLFNEVMKELDRLGADGARLGGARQRYGRYGFEPSGSLIQFSMTEKNRIQGFKNPGEDIVFNEISLNDLKWLQYCNRLTKESEFYVDRSEEDGCLDVYLALGSKHSTPYIALRGGKPIGYLSAMNKENYIGKSDHGNQVLEWRVENPDDAVALICAWQREVGRTVDFAVAPYDLANIRLFGKECESSLLKTPSSFKILSYDKLANALLKLKASTVNLPEIEYVMGIEGWGNLLISTGKEPYCARTDRRADITVTKSEATRILFGHLHSSTVKELPWEIGALLPLPLTWNTLDYV